MKHIRHPIVFVVACIIFHTGIQRLHAQEEKETRLQIDDNALHFRFCEYVNGYWGNANSPGRDKRVLQKPRLVVYTQRLSPGVVRLLKRIDTALPSGEDWAKSVVIVSHENNPMPTESQWNDRLAELGTIATLADLENFSVGLLKRIPDVVSRTPRNVGIFVHGDPVVMVVVPENTELSKGSFRREAPVPYKSKVSFIKYLQPGEAAKWTDKQIVSELAPTFAAAATNGGR